MSPGKHGGAPSRHSPFLLETPSGWPVGAGPSRPAQLQDFEAGERPASLDLCVLVFPPSGARRGGPARAGASVSGRRSGVLGSPGGGEAALVLPSGAIEDTGHSALATFSQTNGEG